MLTPRVQWLLLLTIIFFTAPVVGYEEDIAQGSCASTDSEDIDNDNDKDNDKDNNDGDVDTTCTRSDKRNYQWIPEALDHRCNVRKIDLHRLEFEFEDGLFPSMYHEPIIIRTPLDRNMKLLNITSQRGIVQALPPNFTVTLSSSNSFSAHRRTIPLTQYLNEILKTGITPPDALSNETWYLFGETYSSEWKEHVLRHYILPPCRSCQSEESVALSFGIGNRGSGVQWHVHGPGFAEALWGRKHWILYPPNQRPTNFHPDQTSRNWMEYTYNTLKEEQLPYECTLDPGDMIYFPNSWWHATINLDPYTSFVSTFTTEHGLFD